jgi:hypothetical protein
LLLEHHDELADRGGLGVERLRLGEERGDQRVRWLGRRRGRGAELIRQGQQPIPRQPQDLRNRP